MAARRLQRRRASALHIGSRSTNHLADTAAVAGLLVERWVPPQVLDRTARDLDGAFEDVRRPAVSPAAVHEVGKAGSAFTVQDDPVG